MHSCIICNSPNSRFLYNRTLQKCSSCGFITANIGISAEELTSIYNENYFKGEEYLDYVSDKAVIQKNFIQRLKRLLIDETENINALEIGCAYGFFGELFSRKFGEATFTGLDLAKEAIDYGKDNFGLNLICRDYLNYESNDKYSHIFMWDVIEHLPRPDLYIQKIAEESRDGAELHITTGDIGALLPRLRKEHWRMIHPPSHLHYFSKKTLSLLLEKNGFRVQTISYKPVYRSVKQIFYSLFLLNSSGNRLINRLFKEIPEEWFIPVNTFDIIHCIAVRVRN